ADIHKLLMNEPLWLVRHVLELEHWPWRQEYLDMQIPVRRERLKMRLPSRLPPKVSASLYRQLGQRLTGRATGAAAVPALRRGSAHLFQTLQRKLRQWL